MKKIILSLTLILGLIPLSVLAYTIQKGDTLSKIASKNNTTVSEIVQKNSIQNPNLIYTGQKLDLDSDYLGGNIYIPPRNDNSSSSTTVSSTNGNFTNITSTNSNLGQVMARNIIWDQTATGTSLVVTSSYQLAGRGTLTGNASSSLQWSGTANYSNITFSNGATLTSSTPSSTTNTFYNQGGQIYFGLNPLVNTSVTQGDLVFGSAANVWTNLAKNTSATRYLSNTGTNNNPAWAQINLANGVTGNLPKANGGFGVDVSTGLTNNNVPFVSGGAITIGSLPTGAIPNLSDIQTFTATGTNTWTKPSVGHMTYIYVIGAGGGGGSGRRGATASGGGGGAGGGVSTYTIPTSLLASTETVVVGTGGVGGVAQTSDSTDGNSGTAGTDSIFRHSGTNWIIGKGGGGGGGGSTGTVSGGSAGSPCDFVSAAGGNGNTSSGGTSGTPASGAAGPGGGGGGTSAGSTSNGGIAFLPRGGINSGGTAPGGNGFSGLLSFPTGSPGGGGSGGASTADGITAAGNGGAGGIYGGGGGGGGASVNGANSGKGGDGAHGIVIVITI